MYRIDEHLDKRVLSSFYAVIDGGAAMTVKCLYARMWIHIVDREHLLDVQHSDGL
jgi:hypothetical protein